MFYPKFMSSYVREFVNKGADCRLQTAAAARTRISLGHHLLHPRISRLLVLLTPADFEAQRSMADLSS